MCGIIIASLTWAFSIYLYSRLSQTNDTVNPTMLAYENFNFRKESTINGKAYYDRPFKWNNNLIDTRNKDNTMNTFTYNSKENKYKNSEKLLQQLQPIPVKPSVTLGQGI